MIQNMLWDLPTDLASRDKSCRESWDWKLEKIHEEPEPPKTLPAHPRSFAELLVESTHSCASARFSLSIKPRGETLPSRTCR